MCLSFRPCFRRLSLLDSSFLHTSFVLSDSVDLELRLESNAQSLTRSPCLFFLLGWLVQRLLLRLSVKQPPHSRSQIFGNLSPTASIVATIRIVLKLRPYKRYLKPHYKCVEGYGLQSGSRGN